MDVWGVRDGGAASRQVVQNELLREIEEVSLMEEFAEKGEIPGTRLEIALSSLGANPSFSTEFSSWLLRKRFDRPPFRLYTQCFVGGISPEQYG